MSARRNSNKAYVGILMTLCIFTQSVMPVRSFASEAPSAESRFQYYPKSSYPEVPGSKAPLPSNRSLVVVSEPQSHSPRGSGQAEVNNRYADRYLRSMSMQQFEASGMDDRYRPSKLNELQRLRGRSAQWFKTEVRKMLEGSPNGLVADGTGKSAGSTKLAPVLNVGRGVGVFYIALALMTAIQLQTSYADHPAAWSAYLESATDPAQIAQVVAFLTIMGGALYGGHKLAKKVFGENAIEKRGMRAGIYGGAIFAAVLAGTVLAEMMADPNSSKCTGIASYKETGKWSADTAACDKFWDTWKSNARWNKLASEQILPVFANIVVAGGILQAAGLGARYLLSRQFMVSRIGQINFGFLPKGGPYVALAGVTFRLLLFFGAYEISDKVLGVGKSTREYFAADKSLSTDPHGYAVSEVEKTLLSEWQRLIQSDFKAFEVIPGSLNPANLSFETLLDKYRESLQRWRDLQMSETQAALQQWNKKVYDYYSVLEVATDFYRQASAQIAKDPKGFTPAFAESFAQAQESSGSPSWKRAKAMNFNGIWKYVVTGSLTDYLVASMACGPEVEGYVHGNPGLFSRIGSVYSAWRGNTGPTHVIEDSSGFTVGFNPPKTVRPIDGQQGSVCLRGPGDSWGSYNLTATPTAPEAFGVKDGGKFFPSLYNYVAERTRQSLIDQDQNNFDVWWKSTVGAQAEKAESSLRIDYEKMLKDLYQPALVNANYRYCSTSEVELPGVEKALRGLSDSKTSNCPKDATHRLAQGILNSLNDEMRLYMGLLQELYRLNPSRVGPRFEERDPDTHLRMLQGQMNRMLAVFEEVLRGANQLNSAARPNIVELGNRFRSLSNLQKLQLLAPQILKSEELLQSEKQLEDQRANLELSMELTERIFDEGRGEGTSQLEEARLNVAQISKEVERLQKLADQLAINAAPHAHIEKWAFELGLRIDATFSQAVNLYQILTTFEKNTKL